MSTTFGELKARVSTVLQDPSGRTFTPPLVEELIFAGLSEVGLIAPEQFTEDITLVAGQREYAIRSDDFDGDAVPEIELMRVEVWDPTTDPETLVHTVPDAGLAFSTSDAGWSMWGGTLQLPRRSVSGITGYEGDYVLRVYGYSPYVQPDSDDDVINISKDVEQALIWYVRGEALQMLAASRDLFTQWQTRSGNTDLSFAGLMNQINIAGDMWRRKSRQIARLRSRV